ncbi:MAG: class I SAM-dependent methyltransferase [Archangium sp.]|nr:class I SAM-dependent methyltransferase [Archangium sp.]
MRSFVKKKAPKVSAKARRDAVLRRITWRTKSTGNITFPAIPGLVDHYVEVLENLFAAMGRPFGKGAAASCRAMLAEKIEWAFERSHNASVSVDWKTDQGSATSLTYTVMGLAKTIEEAYAEWVKLRTPPLFGKHADARVMDLAATLGPPGEVTVLDAGAGDGRNSLPLARAGYVVDALELAPVLVEKLEAAARETGADVRSVCGSFYDRGLTLPRERYHLVVLAEVCSHWRGPRDLRNTLLRLSELVEPGGLGLFNVFLAHPGFKPNAVERDFSQIAWCPIYSRQDVAEACEGLPLSLIADESAADYEKAHAPKDGWPPTGWYVRWTSGSEVLDLPADQSQFELRWLTFRRA